MEKQLFILETKGIELLAYILSISFAHRWVVICLLNKATVTRMKCFPFGALYFSIKKYQRNLNVVSIKCTGPDSKAELNFSNHNSMLQSSCDIYCSVGKWAKSNFNTDGLQGCRNSSWMIIIIDNSLSEVRKECELNFFTMHRSEDSAQVPLRENSQIKW